MPVAPLDPKQNDLRAMALAYASRGVPVFPVDRDDKRPLTRHGLNDGSTDEARIRFWWSRWPGANIGILTGSVSGLVVLDVDGEAGTAALDDLQRAHGALPPTASVRTGRPGGMHIYWRHPSGRIPNTAGKIAAHIDSRGDGGYVIAPPSIHANGQRYSWSSRAPLAPLPAWLLDLMVPPAPPRSGVVVPVGAGSRYATAALEAEARDVATTGEGARNHRLNAAAYSLGTLVAVGALDKGAVVGALTSAGHHAGLDDREIAQTIESGMRAGLANPRRSAA